MKGLLLTGLRWTAVGYLSIVLLMSFLERWLVYPAPPPAAGEWSPEGGDFEEAWIDVPPLKGAAATRVHGWFFPHEEASHALLYCHGNGVDVSSLPSLARLLRDQLDAAVLVFDYRGYGKSEGKPFEAGVIADGMAAQRWLAERTGRTPAQTLVVGRSIGGGVATAIVAEQGAAALVVQSGFTTLPAAAAIHYPWLPVRLVMQNRYDSLGRIARYDGPVLISHGTADEVVPFEQGQRLFETAPGFKRFIELPDLSHRQPQPPSYYDDLRAFLADLPAR
ncbi:Alpha/beta hydrolase family protein [Botrimarina colliarenosi]|uniref:Alpha/beta hydrolase family protein n=1 Tax=Botrimarina colliarenosi TaxID=2528001 RepID=A0A5C6AHS1_9BACT|nr:alpha/beta hydrolase [Botrimarina colliarenosi]TWT99544.1 Alpha/beta hydrolase family protein [Botrimarina colliarenosi]